MRKLREIRVRKLSEIPELTLQKEYSTIKNSCRINMRTGEGEEKAHAAQGTGLKGGKFKKKNER